MTAPSHPIPGFAVAPIHGPPQWSPEDRAWHVTRFADLQLLMREPEVRVTEVGDRIERIGKGSGRDFSVLSDLLGGMLIFRNQPFHARGRQFLQRALADLRPSLSEQALRPLVRQRVLDVAAAGRVDAMADICRVLPYKALGSALGLSDETLTAMARSAGPIPDACLPGLLPRQLAQIDAAARDVLAPLSEDVARASSGMGRLLAINKAEFGISQTELTGLVFFLVLAGSQTTASFLGSALYLILAQPDLCRQLRADPALLPAAIEECLRMAPPLRRLSARRVPAGTRLSGVEFSGEEYLMGLIEEAHHDPLAFPDPARFDILRRGQPHAAFAVGSRSCLGAGLARLEARLLIEAVLQDTEAELADAHPRWQDNPLLRRLAELRIDMKPLRKSKN